ncbi:MAG TPA: N-acetylmuramidase domain-containing protein [Pseudoxanthomonas sp.]|jgi:hypothetical protein|nr:N-acetylmuramidase domain-containing protein [Pseudoxanthomonas sp.]
MAGNDKMLVTEAKWNELAKRLEADVAALKAIASVESAGSGFLPDQRPKVLFEGHVFHRLTAGRFGLTHPKLSYPKWNRKMYAGSASGEWERLEQAATLDVAAAMQAASWGTFQIMGFNYALCGFDSVGRFVEAHSRDAESQAEAFANLIGRPRSPLIGPLRDKDWAAFARLYNGPGFRENRYDTKMAEAYARFSGKPRAGSTARGRANALPPGRPEMAPLELLESSLPPAQRKRNNRLLNVRPDAVDLRDWEYQPPVSSAPQDVHYPNDTRPILDQGQTSACTGFSLAVVIEYLLMRAHRHVESVSPHMLYNMARRYDEWAENDDGADEPDSGSSLRGALKGWLRHGAAALRFWPEMPMPDPKPKADADWWTDAIKRPLGAYYRINPKSLRDMHVAIDQVGALYCSAFTHRGWQELFRDVPRVRPEVPNELPLIRCQRGDPDGGHAFAIVGYTRDGFIVHNSWGSEWGDGGLAVLTYSDWLKNAMDCWVAQLGVVTAEHEAIANAVSLRHDDEDSGRAVVSSNPVLAAHELSPFIINMENNGRLSTRGQFRTQKADVEALLSIHMREACKKWEIPANGELNVVIYAHGGLVNEDAAAESARFWVPKLYNERIFPIFLMWETGAIKTVTNMIADKITSDAAQRAGGAWSRLKDELKEFWNERIETLARPLGRPLWREMKENAGKIGSDPESGVGLLFEQFKTNKDKLKLPKIRLHLIGHSAGAILHNHLGVSAIDAGFNLRSVALIAPAVRVDEFDRNLGAKIAGKDVTLLIGHLTDAAERADSTCKPYGHSLLYLVSRSFEDRNETPILGLERDLVPARATLAWGARTWAVSSPQSTVASLPSAQNLQQAASRPPEAVTHGSLDDDKALQEVIFKMIRKA